MQGVARLRAFLQISGLLLSRLVHLNTYDGTKHTIILSLMCGIFKFELKYREVWLIRGTCMLILEGHFTVKLFHLMLLKKF